MKVGFAQFDCHFGDKEYNLRAIDRLSSELDADLLLFPEMCVTGYMVRDYAELVSMAEPLAESPTVRTLTTIARKTSKTLIVGMPEREGDKVFNTAVVVGPEGGITKHQKTHLFLKEKLYFSPGTTLPTIFDFQGSKIGLGVCYDYMFPEYWRTLALQGALLFCNIANFVFPYGFKMMQARALENGVYGVCCNRIGTERGCSFTGGSEIVDTRGNVLLKASDQEESYIQELDLALAANKQWNDYNDLLRDRRPKMYRL